jgi:hypothetical protein
MSPLLVASFRSDTELRLASQRARHAGIGTVETYTPAPSDVTPDVSPLPLVILLAGLTGAAAGYLMQVYAAMVSYPMNIGGRPDLSWPSFVPIAFEIGVLAAVAAGFFGFLIINRMPCLYDPIDEADILREASRARWLLVIRPFNEAATMEARALIRELPVADYEELAP